MATNQKVACSSHAGRTTNLKYFRYLQAYSQHALVCSGLDCAQNCAYPKPSVRSQSRPACCVPAGGRSVSWWTGRGARPGSERPRIHERGPTRQAGVAERVRYARFWHVRPN